MTRKHKLLLTADAIVNLLLGAALLLLPLGLLELLGLPPTNTYFYSSLLGAVIFGIGIALLLELRSGPPRLHGLGLAGAIAINLCGGAVLLVWLAAVPHEIPPRGKIILWIVAILVLGLGAAEIAAKSWQNEE
jgi:hypothetical protein